MHQTEAFAIFRNALSEATAMPYMDPDKPTNLLVDASPVGLAEILTE